MKNLLATVLAALLLGAVGTHAQNLKKQTCNIVFIGNSITEGALHTNKAKTAPPVFAAEFVGKALSCNVNFRNCGRSGATTVDFRPDQNKDFKRVKKAIEDIQALSYEPITFSIMLGTNDSANFGPNGSPVSNSDYKKNLLTMINEIRRLCPNAIFVLQQPIWYSPNTHNASQYLVAGQKRMIGYTNILIELAAENKDIYFPFVIFKVCITSMQQRTPQGITILAVKLCSTETTVDEFIVGWWLLVVFIDPLIEPINIFLSKGPSVELNVAQNIRQS